MAVEDTQVSVVAHGTMRQRLESSISSQGTPKVVANLRKLGERGMVLGRDGPYSHSSLDSTLPENVTEMFSDFGLMGLCYSLHRGLTQEGSWSLGYVYLLSNLGRQIFEVS